MLLISLLLTFLSPLTTLVVKSEDVPTITLFRHFFFNPLHETQKVKNLKLVCTASGNPPPRIKFKFFANDASYGKPLNSNQSKVTKLSATEILINKVSAADTGTYRCIAVNSNGRVFKNQKIHIDVAGSFFQGEYSTDSPITIATELGRQQEIVCPIKTYPYPLKFSWGSLQDKRRPMFITENERIHITEKGTLFYSHMTKEDVYEINRVGGISCIMYHEGEAILSRKNRLRIEKDNVSYVAPFLYAKVTGTTYILKGERGKTLRCIGGGNPVPHITWFKDGEEITSEDPSYTIKASTPGKLTINEFEEELAGNYKCSLSNRVGRVESSGNVYLAAVPTLVRSLLPNTDALLGRRLELTCQADGTIPMRYEWYRNGKPMTSYKTLISMMQVSEGNLLIEPVTNKSKGTYQCYAINAYGNTYSSTKVVVKEPTVTSRGVVATNRPMTKGTTDRASVARGSRRKTSDDSLQLKYIIIIACSGAVFVVLVCGGILMYSNQKRNDLDFEVTRMDLKRVSFEDVSNLPPPPPSLTDHSDDDFSSYGGYKSNHPLYYNDNTMMYLMNHNKEEHLYADIPEDYTRCGSATPSTEL